MTAEELKKRYLDFFVKKGHKKLPNVSLIPENDPTALFINSGMHPLVPYLLGENHPLGKRLVSNQRCLRTQDIEEIGNMMHLTFFEMLGNWSLGDYWKKEAIEWSWEFLTKELNLEPKRIYVTCFSGDKDAPKDEEAVGIWRKIGLPKERIYFLGKEDNWWAVGDSGPCGPDSEMFYDTGKKKCGPKCHPGDNCGKYFEVWNDVFMEFNRLANGKLEKLRQQNIDTGMGVERTTAMLQGKDDVYQTELFTSIIQTIEKISNKRYQGESQKPIRIIADHVRAATFAIADGVTPSNVEAGYIVRRLIRRAANEGKKLGLEGKFLNKLAVEVIENSGAEYRFLNNQKNLILQKIELEETASQEVYSSKGMEFSNKWQKEIFQKMKAGELTRIQAVQESATLAHDSLATYGIYPDVTFETARNLGTVSPQYEKEWWKKFNEEAEQHKEKSRASLEKKFAGGLADHSATVTKLHTATHLLHRALRDVLGNHVQQIGSNITPERLRFDFTHPEKLTEAQVREVEKVINEKIKAKLPVKMEMMSLEEARKKGALAFFAEKYGDKVKVYSIGDYSKEVCGGPHVGSTGEIGGVKITKEKPVGAGRRRLYIVLAHGS